MRNLQRSVRLDDELQSSIEALPHGSFNNVVNGLLSKFFADETLYHEILDPTIRTKPVTIRPPKPKAKPEPEQLNVIDASKDRAEELETHEKIEEPSLPPNLGIVSTEPVPVAPLPTKKPITNLDDLMPGL